MNQFNCQNMAKIVFMVAEKPSLAASLANILSDGRNTSRKASNGACQVHEWKGIFYNQPACFRMTSVCGHVLSIDFLSKYNNWDRVDPLELFSCPVERKEATPKLRMLSFLAEESRGSDYLVLWLDCDKEGENICFEVIDAVKNSLKRSIQNPDVVWRAKFSSITAVDVKYAMNNLIKPNKNESLSVDARQELDLRIGCAFTRYQTKYFQGKYGNLDSSLISFGPCQTPTLGFCVERHDQIQSFKPEPYWMLKVDVVTGDNQELELNHQSGRIFDKETGRTLFQKIRGLKTLKVTNVTTKDKNKVRPVGLNTVELMKYASSGLGLGPHYAMSLAERLYMNSYISYPRTESTGYSDNFDLKEVLLMYKDHVEYSEFVANILRDGITRPRKGINVGDHPPITPMKRATIEELGESWKLYDYIVRHFIATVSKDCHYKNILTTFVGDSETFTCNVDVLVDPGFTQVMPWHSLNRCKLINFKIGDEVSVRNVNLGDYKTTPPDYLTESELITMMEKHGIGTDASIPVHINNISQRNYVTVGGHRRLIPTNLGIILVHGYQKIDKELVEPNMRSRLEEQLNLIALGKASFDIVLSDAIKLFKDKFIYFTKSIESMDHLFEVSFTPLSETGKALSRCGKCRRYMKYIQAKPSRLHCAVCNETYSLPQNGNIRKYKESRCPMDEFEILIWSAGAKGKSYPLCPYCYNNPPFEEMQKFSGCNHCIHLTCSESIYSVGIASCLDCTQGILCLDPSSGPKWKVVCNCCDTVLDVFDDAQKVTVDKESCSCGSKFVKVEYKEEKTKLPGDRAEMLACMFCCPDLEPLVKQHRAVNSCAAFPSGRGRGGRGGNRKGKNRGRGRGAGGRGAIAGAGAGGRPTDGEARNADASPDVVDGAVGGAGRGCGRGGNGGAGGRGRRRNRPKPPKDRMAQLAAYFV